MFVVAVVGMLAVSCSPMKKSLVGQLESPVTELAIRVVKDGNEEAFKDSRRKFISVLKGQKGFCPTVNSNPFMLCQSRIASKYLLV